MIRSFVVRFLINGAAPAAAIAWWWPATLGDVLFMLLGFVALACYFSDLDGYDDGRRERDYCETIDEAYICADCRAEIAAEEAEAESLRQQLRGAVSLDDAEGAVLNALGPVINQGHTLGEHVDAVMDALRVAGGQ